MITIPALIFVVLAGFIAGYLHNRHQYLSEGFVFVGLVGVCVSLIPIHNNDYVFAIFIGLLGALAIIYLIGKAVAYVMEPTVGGNILGIKPGRKRGELPTRSDSTRGCSR